MRSLLFCLIASLGLWSQAGPARAHGEFAWIQERDARTGDSCCGVNDCYKVQVEIGCNGRCYNFTHAGDSYSISIELAKPSEDGEYWACIPRPGVLRCFFAPPQGS